MPMMHEQQEPSRPPPQYLGGALLGSFSRGLVGTSDEVAVVSPFDLHILILGQSNARGQGDTNTADTGLSLATPYAPTQYNMQGGAANTDPINYDAILATGSLRPFVGIGAPNFGIELAFGRYLVKTRGATAPYISKIAVNGQDIETMIPGAGTPVSPKEMYLQIRDYVDARVAECGRNPDYVIFSQWEADATAQLKADNYSSNLNTLFAALRARYGNFHTVMHKASSTATGGGILSGARDTIRATQVTWCAVGGNNATLVDTDGLPLSNNIHYDQDALVVLGIRDAEIIATRNAPGRNTDQGTGPAPWLQGSDMPMGSSLTTSTVTPWLPMHKVGDILVVAVVTSVTATAPTLSTANGFAQLGSSVVNGVNMVLSVYTKTATSTSESPPIFTPAGDAERTIAVAFSIRGSSGTDVASTTSSGSTTPASQPCPVTSSANDLVVVISGVNTGNQSQAITSWTDANLTAFANVRDTRRVLSSNALMVGLATGTKAVAGATGPASASYSTAPFWASMAIAFKP